MNSASKFDIYLVKQTTLPCLPVLYFFKGLFIRSKIILFLITRLAHVLLCYIIYIKILNSTIRLHVEFKLYSLSFKYQPGSCVNVNNHNYLLLFKSPSCGCLQVHVCVRILCTCILILIFSYNKYAFFMV